MSADPDAKIGHLVSSTNPGRYAIDDMQYGPGLTTGTDVEVLIGEHWYRGQIQHSQLMSASGMYAITDGVAHGVFVGYFLQLNNGSVLGLCTGMQVKIVR